MMGHFHVKMLQREPDHATSVVFNSALAKEIVILRVALYPRRVGKIQVIHTPQGLHTC